MASFGQGLARVCKYSKFVLEEWIHAPELWIYCSCINMYSESRVQCAWLVFSVYVQIQYNTCLHVLLILAD
jgi:hypothetical protein